MAFGRLAQLARASRLHRGGHRFESYTAHHFNPTKSLVSSDFFYMIKAMNNYEGALDWLNQLASEKKFFRDKQPPSLVNVNHMLDKLGRPDESFDYRVIIGGTAGKGTTCRYIEQTLLEQNKSVALLSSPHLQVINERIRLNGRLISQEKLNKGLYHIQKICNEAQIEPTYYEAIVVTGIYLAAKANIEILICEVGIGGEFDAVNAVSGKRISAVTFIGNDHLEMFGGKMENLAMAKAGIFTKESVLNLTYEQKYSSIFEKTSNNNLTYIKGIKQKMNKKIARKICEQILCSNDFEMNLPKLPARWEKIGGNLILDGAHSAPRFEYILPKIKKLKRPRIGIFGLGANHDPEIFSIIIPEFDHVIWSEVPEMRITWTAKELFDKFEIGSCEPIPKKALEIAQEWAEKNDGIIFTNGLFLSGAIREAFYPGQEILKQQTEFPK